MTQEITTTESDVCPECNSRHIVRDYDRGELICKDCGLVLDEKYIDPGREWRVFANNDGEDRARTGAGETRLLHDKGLSTEIGWKNTDSQGKSLPAANRKQMYRLRKWQKRIRVANAVERNLSVALAEISLMSNQMGLPHSALEQACTLYKKLATKNLIRGRSIAGMCAACLYCACRMCGVPRTLDEVSDASGLARKEIGRNYRFMVKALGIKMEITKPQDYVQRFCSELGLSTKVQAETMELLRVAYDHELCSGRGPVGIAAAAIYIKAVMCGEPRTQRQIAEVAGVTEITVRSRYKELTDKLGVNIQL